MRSRTSRRSLTSTLQDQSAALAIHFGRRKDELLRMWREAIRSDPELTSSTGLSRSVLEDHIPKILDDFAHRLQAEHALQAMHVDLQQRQDAAEHGRHRWQQGFDIRETMREWGHLQSVMLGELERYLVEHPGLEPGMMPAARAVLAKLCMEGNCESASRYMLSIVKRLCDLLGATLDLVTAPGHGTTFRIAFPVRNLPRGGT